MEKKFIINKIKEKKSLISLDDSYVDYFINKFLNLNYKIKKKYINNNLKKSDLIMIVKGVRNELNKTYGQFWLNELNNLESHKSTKERINNYKKIYDNIFKITGVPKVLFDISAGLNPITYSLIKNNTYFIVSELTDNDCKRLANYFKKENINGNVIKINLFNYEKLPKSDICLLFKILDLFDDHKLAEKLIKDIETKYIVVSFSTIDINNKRMNYPKRGWFEKMLGRINLTYNKFETNNEIFYIIKKD